MERRLGKGLGSLLGESEVTGGVSELNVNAIKPNPFQPRSSMDSDSLEITFEKAQRAITPGQLAVFYNRDRVIGSAWIENIITK